MTASERPNQWLQPLRVIGQQAVDHMVAAMVFIAFIGELFCFFVGSFKRRGSIPWRNFFKTLELTGYNALPIIGLLSCLVGVVMAYQIGLELSRYGASIFTVDLLGLSILREFGPLIAAIIIAGRTGSSYTAEIGAMKINEELDALRTFGLSPTEYLVLPKLLGLMLALPLLIVWADAFGGC